MVDFVHKFIVILPSVTRTLDNSNLSLTRINFHFPSRNFVYIFTLDNSNNIFQDVTSKKVDVPEVLDTQDTWVLKTEGIGFPIRTAAGE